MDRARFPWEWLLSQVCPPHLSPFLLLVPYSVSSFAEAQMFSSAAACPMEPSEKDEIGRASFLVPADMTGGLPMSSMSPSILLSEP